MDPFLFHLNKALVSEDEVKGKSILEVGSYIIGVNGSFRSNFTVFNPSEYIGIDITSGPGVDMICDVTDILNKFGPERFDIIVCTEVIEHVRDWRTAILNMMQVLKLNGIIYLTSRSKGFGIHSYPSDYWRYEIEDIREIFKEFEIQVLHKDKFQNDHFGFFLKAVKRNGALPDLTNIALYNINTDPKQGLENNNIRRTLTQ